MAEFLGLGMTHYPLLAGTDDNMAGLLRWTLTDPDIPDAAKDPASWSESMQAEWGDDQGRASAAGHRAALVAGLGKVRAALDDFRPDIVVVWGDDQYENFREEVVPPFCVLAYGDIEVLRGVDLAVDEHRAVALIGASGSGKSTLLRVVDLLEEIGDGDVLLDGEVITDPSVDAVSVRRRLGLVFQAYNLFPHLSVLENVVLGRWRGHGVPKGEAEEAARAQLKRLGLEGREDDQPEAIDRRLRDYHEKTKPVVEHYRATGKLVGVHAERSIEDVWAEIADALEQLQARA